MNYCAICNKPVGDGEYDGKYCESGCDRRFCSDDCADLDHLENTFPNCCPGVYWCCLCKKEYLELAQGHLFMIANHEAHPDLEKYLGTDKDYSNGAFVEKCMNCKMWCYEVKSGTDMLGKYENYACEVWLEDII